MPEALIRLIGPEPSRQRDRHAWRSAVESTALYRERYEVTPVGRDGVRAVLGDRPTDGLAGAEYAEAARLIAEAQVAARSADLAVGPEL